MEKRKTIDPSESHSTERIIEKLNSLEKRIHGIESYLGLERIEAKSESDKISPDQDSGNLVSESNIVENGLTWLSSLIFIIGIIFLLNYVKNLSYPVLAVIIGYLSAIGIMTFAYLFKKNYPHLVFALNINSLILIYYITLKLHFFSTEPVIANSGIAIFFLLAAVFGQYYYAIKRNSESLSIMAAVFLLLSGLFIDSTHITLPIIVVAIIFSIYFLIQKGWTSQVVIVLILSYITHLIWLLNNPVMGHKATAVEDPQYNLIYLFIYGLLFALILVFKTKKDFSDSFLGALLILNAISFSMLISLESILFYGESYQWIFMSVSLFCLLYSIILKYKGSISFTPALYAGFGFMALSISIYGFLNLPESYLFLILQSFLVVSMALWYKSRLIVLGNTILFLLILIIYYFGSPSINSINFMIAFVALATARILNWKKERLTLKTEYLRNIYLLVAFTMILYSLSEALPSKYVTLSWILTAIIFIILSFSLKNIKYRWMAIVTIIVAGVHLLLIDMDNMSAGFKIIVFLVFAFITLAISLFYSKKIKKKQANDK